MAPVLGRGNIFAKGVREQVTSITVKDTDASERKVSAKVVVISIPSLRSMSIVSALPDRTWMNSLEAADRWLPTSIANQAGWMILNDRQIEMTWNGGKNPSDLLISIPEGGATSCVFSHFGNGIATWKLPFLFRLPSEVNLRLRGPTNWPREGAFPIEQLLDPASGNVDVWMNWKVTAIGIPIRFEVGEPLCMIYPELRGLTDEVDPQIHFIDSEIALEGNGVSLSKRGFGSVLPDRDGGRQETSEVNETTHPAANQSEVSVHLTEEQGAGSRRGLGDFSLGTNRDDVPSQGRSRLESFYVEKDFYDQAALLRNQFERAISSASSTGPTVNPLTFAYSENAYQFIAATAERMFNADLLFSLLDRLRAWARQSVGATHASTPRVQVYVHGSQRHIAKDDIRVGWHFLLSLTRDEKQTRRVEVLLESASEISGRVGVGVSRVDRIKLNFNELLVHETKCAYGIDRVKGSTNPLEGLVLLEGYLW
jgi:Family of unknown function (DUF6065)